MGNLPPPLLYMVRSCNSVTLHQMEALTHAFIFLIGTFSSFVGTAVGGFGLLLVPSLVFVGLSAQAAVATTRLGLMAGNVTSLYQFHKHKKIEYGIAIPLLILSAAGAFIGSYALLSTPSEAVEKLFGLFILCIVGASLFKKDVGVIKQAPPSRLMRLVGYVLLFFISIISAYFSGGTGLLGRSVLMHCFGQTFLESAGTRKLQSAAIGITSIAVYVSSGVVHWPFAISLMIAVAIGSYTGAAYAIKKGDAWLKKLFIVAVVLSAIELLI